MHVLTVHRGLIYEISPVDIDYPLLLTSEFSQRRMMEHNSMLKDYRGIEVVGFTSPDQEDPIPPSSLPTSSRTARHSLRADTHATVLQAIVKATTLNS